MLCKQSQLAETEPVHLTFLLELRENGKYVKKKNHYSGIVKRPPIHNNKLMRIC